LPEAVQAGQSAASRRIERLCVFPYAIKSWGNRDFRFVVIGESEYWVIDQIASDEKEVCGLAGLLVAVRAGLRIARGGVHSRWQTAPVIA
jgi:hypothetical protein